MKHIIVENNKITYQEGFLSSSYISSNGSQFYGTEDGIVSRNHVVEELTSAVNNVETIGTTAQTVFTKELDTYDNVIVHVFVDLTINLTAANIANITSDTRIILNVYGYEIPVAVLPQEEFTHTLYVPIIFTSANHTMTISLSSTMDINCTVSFLNIMYLSTQDPDTMIE